MISNEDIESFLHGNDPEEFIVAIEFDYASNSIFKIKEIPGKGKEIRKDTFTPFAWVGDLRNINFYNGSKSAQQAAMTKHGITIDKLETHGDERLQKGMTFMVKSLKGYRELIQFFREGGCDPWGETTKDKLLSDFKSQVNMSGNDLNKSMNYLNNKKDEWCNNDLLTKMAQKPGLMKLFSNPKFPEAIALMQKDQV